MLGVLRRQMERGPRFLPVRLWLWRAAGPMEDLPP
jgi:hypothetical protein